MKCTEGKLYLDLESDQGHRSTQIAQFPLDKYKDARYNFPPSLPSPPTAFTPIQKSRSLNLNGLFYDRYSSKEVRQFPELQKYGTLTFYALTYLSLQLASRPSSLTVGYDLFFTRDKFSSLAQSERPVTNNKFNLLFGGMK